MSKIHRLPESVQHKIAAGEVIERPASVLKELLENAIDAGSTEIEVELENGGIDLIAVRDNGEGMSREDAILAFERYATSKLDEEASLFEIKTLGFRGEALASIAAVSRTELVTKQAGELEGARIEVEGGAIRAAEPAGCAPGTEVSMRRLFFNTPVRKKYLKSVNTENRHSTQVFEDQALAHPEVAMRLISNGKLVHELAPSEDRLDRIRAILGEDWAGNLIPVQHDEAPNRVVGFIAKPEGARRTSKHQYLYVNGRRVDDHILAYRLKDAYGTLLDHQAKPSFVLFLSLPPESVDVNVHPRKAEVKFQNPQQVFSLVRAAAQVALKQHDLVPSASLGGALGEMGSTVGESGSTFGGNQIPSGSPFGKGMEGPHAGFELTEQDKAGWVRAAWREAPAVGYQPGLTKPRQQGMDVAHPMRPLAQLYATYLVAERAGEVFLIDQHAAQERVMYERLMQQYQDDALQTQPLLTPVPVELSVGELALVLENSDLLRSVGIELSQSGPQELSVYAVPMQLAGKDLKRLIQGFVDELSEEASPQAQSQPIVDRLIMRSCKLSIKANERLDERQQQKVIDDLLACETPYTCPHGRPTIVRLTAVELEKLFGRR